MAFHDRNRIQVQLWHFNRRISKVDSTTVKLLRLADPLVSFPVGSCKFEFLPWDSQVGLSANPSSLYDLANGLDFPALTEFIASKNLSCVAVVLDDITEDEPGRRSILPTLLPPFVKGVKVALGGPEGASHAGSPRQRELIWHVMASHCGDYIVIPR